MMLSAVSVLVPDYDAGIAFFVDVLGFDLVEDSPQGDKRWVRVQPKGAQTGFILARASGPEQVSAVGTQGGGRVWLFLQSNDFLADYDRLRSRGVAFEGAPRHEDYGSVAVFRDPFGNRWDLIGPSVPQSPA